MCVCLLFAVYLEFRSLYFESMTTESDDLGGERMAATIPIKLIYKLLYYFDFSGNRTTKYHNFMYFVLFIIYIFRLFMSLRYTLRNKIHSEIK